MLGLSSISERSEMRCEEAHSEIRLRYGNAELVSEFRNKAEGGSDTEE